MELALGGHTAIMATIVRESDDPYRWRIGQVPLEQVANREKMMPREFITEDGFGISQACRTYLEPLILGEDYPPYEDGLPRYGGLRQHRGRAAAGFVRRRLAESRLTLGFKGRRWNRRRSSSRRWCSTS